MPGVSWTTSEEEALLESFKDKYMLLVPTKNYGDFWTTIRKAWESQFPECPRVFPRKVEADLTPAEEEELRIAKEKRLTQLQTWFRWRAKQISRASKLSAKVENEFFDVRTRSSTDYAQFWKMYGDEHSTELQEKYTKADVKDCGEKLNIWREFAKMKYAQASDSVKAEVQSIIEKEKGKGNEEEVNECSPEHYLEMIEKCPIVIANFLEILSKKTGWSFSILMGGPQPAENGSIEVRHFHVGKDKFGNKFSQSHLTFDNACVRPFFQFLEDVYSEDDKKAMTLGYVAPSSSEKKEVLPEDVPQPPRDSDQQSRDKREHDPKEVAPPSPAPATPPSPVPPVTPPSPAPPVTPPSPAPQATPPTPAPPVTPPSPAPQATPPTPALPVTPPSPAPPVTPPSPALQGTPPSPEPQATPPSPAPQATPPSSSSSAPPAMLQHSAPPARFPFPVPPAASDPMQFDFTSMVYGSGMAPFGNTNLFSDQSFMDLPPSGTPPGLDWGIVNSMGMNHFVDGIKNGITGGSWMPSLSACGFSTDASNGASSFLADLYNNQLSVSGVADNATPSHNTQLPPVPPHNHALPTPQHEGQDLGNTLADEASTKQPLSSVNTNKPLSTSRSGRVITPSSRADKLNQIGTSSVTAREKENISGPTSGDQVPPWAITAKNHLTTRPLGPEWEQCVQAWWTLETLLGFGGLRARGGALPGSDKRPEEWGKWTSKSRNGHRSYDQVPTIRSALEFGLAVTAWWHDIQPAFRKSTNSLPDGIYLPPADEATTDHWAPLRKSGPNGLVCAMTMLVWWGQAALVPCQWEDDSKPSWVALVNDVRLAIEKMHSTGVKRSGEQVKGSSKRARVSIS